MVDLSIIIISYNTKNILKECLKKTYTTKRKFIKEVIVIDNNSSDKSPELVKSEFPEVILIVNDKNIGFAAANNQGLRIAKGRYCLLLNSDTFLPPAGLKEAINFMDRNKDAGILGCQLLDAEGEEIISSRRFLRPWQLFLTRTEKLHKFFPKKILKRIIEDKEKATKIKEIVETDWVPGCFFMVRKEVCNNIGLLDESYFLYGEEKDFCFRAKHAGWKIICYPHLRVVHLKGESVKAIGVKLDDENQLPMQQMQSEYIFYKKNYGIIPMFEDYFFNLSSFFCRALKNIYKPHLLKHLFVYTILNTKAFIRANLIGYTK